MKYASVYKDYDQVEEVVRKSAGALRIVKIGFRPDQGDPLYVVPKGQSHTGDYGYIYRMQGDKMMVETKLVDNLFLREEALEMLEADKTNRELAEAIARAEVSKTEAYVRYGKTQVAVQSKVEIDTSEMMEMTVSEASKFFDCRPQAINAKARRNRILVGNRNGKRTVFVLDGKLVTS